MGRDRDSAALADAVERLSTWLRRQVRLPVSASTLTTLDSLAVGGPARLSDLAAREAVSQPGMTGLVNRLEAAGYAERIADPDDGRVALVRITDDGRAVLAERQQARTRALSTCVAELDDDDRAALATAVPVIQKLIAMTAAVPAGSRETVTV